jgi:hypothetical protein
MNKNSYKGGYYEKLCVARGCLALPHGDVVCSVVGTIALAMAGQSTPEVIVTLGSAAIGGSARFLVLTHLNR